MKYVAHVTIETKTPIRIGSSKVDFVIDMPVLRDFNDLPFIPGTSIAGILRKEFENADEIFGYEREKNRDGQGSKVVFSNALLVDNEGKVCETLLPQKNPFLQIFDELPIREHTAIDEKGVAKEHSKFDEEVLYAGTRFRFAIECEEEKVFKEIIEKLADEHLRIGAGKTKGFGAFKIVKIEYEEMNEERYATYSASLNETLRSKIDVEPRNNPNYIHYQLRLQPELTYMFGSGYMDDGVDMTYVQEDVIDYESRELKKRKVLIPASSVKGAIAHRTLFYYNEQRENYCDDEYDKEPPKELFGRKKGDSDERAGNILLSDCYLDDVIEKIFDHVCIDRFTGGAKDGALYQERVVTSDAFTIDMYVSNKVPDDVLRAFEKALKDVTNGLLPLGGNVAKGHGIFEGEVLKDGVPL